MTNAEIIMSNQIELIEKGVIGKYDAIHTYQMWKSLGFQVRKGEHAVAKFAVWKPAKGKKEKSDDEKTENKKPYMFLKTANFFSSSQVDPIV